MCLINYLLAFNNTDLIQVNITIGLEKLLIRTGFTQYSLIVQGFLPPFGGWCPSTSLFLANLATDSSGLLFSFYTLVCWCDNTPCQAWCDNIGNVVANIIIGVVGMIANVIGNGLPMMLRLLVYWQQHWQPA